MHILTVTFNFFGTSHNKHFSLYIYEVTEAIKQLHYHHAATHMMAVAATSSVTLGWFFIIVTSCLLQCTLAATS